MENMSISILLLYIAMITVNSQVQLVTVSICREANFVGCEDRITTTGGCTSLAFAPRSARTIGSTTSCSFYTSSTCSGLALSIGPSGHPALGGTHIRALCAIAPALLTVCPETNFGGICQDRIIIPGTGCHSIAFAPRSARPSASNLLCTLYTTTNCAGSFVNVGSGQASLGGVHNSAGCGML